ncbi:MAG TPA: hypothetical protein VHT49_02750 [Acidimicrobiales bacterium]|nr:hypothetical protein [Acidimicrobiales bacterium]
MRGSPCWRAKSSTSRDSKRTGVLGWWIMTDLRTTPEAYVQSGSVTATK